jgi:hypothetical protein
VWLVLLSCWPQSQHCSCRHNQCTYKRALDCTTHTSAAALATAIASLQATTSELSGSRLPAFTGLLGDLSQRFPVGSLAMQNALEKLNFIDSQVVELVGRSWSSREQLATTAALVGGIYKCKWACLLHLAYCLVVRPSLHAKSIPPTVTGAGP